MRQYVNLPRFVPLDESGKLRVAPESVETS
jgi:hypothetical protein